MVKTAKQKLNIVFWIIAGLAFASGLAILAGSLKIFHQDFKQLLAVSLLVVVPLLIEAFGALGIIEHWFDTWRLRAGKIVNILQWIAGILGVAAIFDAVMRLMRQATWMTDDPFVFVIDSILFILFVLWMIVSHLINKDAKERKVCEFC